MEAKESEWRLASEAKEEQLRQSHEMAQQARDADWQRVLKKAQLEAQEQQKVH